MTLFLFLLLTIKRLYATMPLSDPYRRLWSVQSGVSTGTPGATAGAVAPVSQAVAAATRGGQGGPRIPQVGPDLVQGKPSLGRHMVGTKLPSKPGSGMKRGTPTVSRRVANKMAKFNGDLTALEGSLSDLRKTRLLAQRGYISPDDVNILANDGRAKRASKHGRLPVPGSRAPMVADDSAPSAAAVGSAPYEVGLTPDTSQPPPTNPIDIAPVKSGGADAVDINGQGAEVAAGTTGRTVQKQMKKGGVQSKPTPSQQQSTSCCASGSKKSVMFSRMESL